MAVLTLSDLRLNYQFLGAPDPAPPGAADARSDPAPDTGPDTGAPRTPPPPGTPALLVHGLGANLAFWYLGAARQIGGGRPLLLPDLRGHGASSMPAAGYGLERQAADLLALLDHLGLAQVHLVGHSHGARVALVLAAAQPRRIASLTLADTQIRALQPPVRLSDWPHWPRWKAELLAQGVTSLPPEDAPIDFRLLAELGPRAAGGPVGGPAGGGLAGGGLAGRAGGRLAGALAARRAAQDATRDAEPAAAAAAGPRRISLRSRQMGARGSRQWQRLLDDTTAGTELHDESPITPAALARLDMPVLLVYGALSHCLPTAERLQALIPGARRLMVPGAGHFFPIVKPRFCALALQRFFAMVEAGTARSPAAGTTSGTAPDSAVDAAAPSAPERAPDSAPVARRRRLRRGAGAGLAARRGGAPR